MISTKILDDVIRRHCGRLLEDARIYGVEATSLYIRRRYWATIIGRYRKAMRVIT